MWLLVGELRRVLERPNPKEGTPKYQMQLLAVETLQNGEDRETLFTIGLDRPESVSPLVGEQVLVEVSPFARKDGSLGLMRSEGGRIQRFSPSLLDTRA